MLDAASSRPVVGALPTSARGVPVQVRALLPAEQARLNGKLAVSQNPVLVTLNGHSQIDRGSLSTDTEERIAQLAVFLQAEVIGTPSHRGDVPQIEVVFPGADGKVNPRVELTSPYTYEREPSRYRIAASALGPNGTLDMVLLMPTSGHCGLENAVKWCERDGVYNIALDSATSGNAQVRHTAVVGDKVVLAHGGGLKVGAGGMLIAVQDLTLSGLKPGNNRISFFADGSGGVMGAPPERQIFIQITE